MATGQNRRSEVEQEEAMDEAMEGFHEAREAAIEAYANLLDAKQKFTAAARAAGVDMKETTQEHIEEAYEQARLRKTEWQARSEEYVHQHPVATAGILFATGFLFSRLLSK